MLQVNPETVCRLIELAQSYHVREQTVIPEEGSNSVDDWSQQMLADHKDNTSYKEFAATVNGLDADQQQEGQEQHGHSCQELNARPPM